MSLKGGGCIAPREPLHSSLDDRVRPHLKTNNKKTLRERIISKYLDKSLENSILRGRIKEENGQIDMVVDFIVVPPERQKTNKQNPYI